MYSPDDRWARIWLFPQYLVDRQGTVMKEDDGRILARTYNQQGVAKVTLFDRGHKTDRSVAYLVAESFIYKPNPNFDSVIILNNEYDDIRVDNLAWRPRFFAMKYRKQFDSQQTTFVGPVRDVETGAIYDDGMHAAIANGLLATDIYLAFANGTVCWPTGQRFSPVF